MRLRLPRGRTGARRSVPCSLRLSCRRAVSAAGSSTASVTPAVPRTSASSVPRRAARHPTSSSCSSPAARTRSATQAKAVGLNVHRAVRVQEPLQRRLGPDQPQRRRQARRGSRASATSTRRTTTRSARDDRRSGARDRDPDDRRRRRPDSRLYAASGVKVAVMDTGIDLDHPDLGGDGVAGGTHRPNSRVVAGMGLRRRRLQRRSRERELQPGAEPRSASPDDCNGHGTHVAGIVGANGTVQAERDRRRARRHVRRVPRLRLRRLGDATT